MNSSAHILLLAVLLPAAGAFGQQAAKPQPEPPVKVNVVNVCTPTPEEQKDISTVLSKITTHPVFAPDFEVARGRSTAPDAPVSNWVRLRKEFPAEAPYISAQYAISVDEKGIVESLVLRGRDTSDIVQVVMEDKVTSSSPSQAIATQTPVNRIRVERMGKPFHGLARCQDVDQSSYEPIFGQATALMGSYRSALRVGSTVGAELSKLGVAGAVAEKPPAGKQPQSMKKNPGKKE